MRRAAPRHAPGGSTAGLNPEESIIEYTIDPITAFEQAEVLVDKFLAIPDRPTARSLRERSDRFHGSPDASGAPGAGAA